MNKNLIIPIVAAVLALAAWLIFRGHYEGKKQQWIPPLATFVGVLILGNIGMGFVQGIREASRSGGKKPPKG
ncbi:MAG: hypothetical protein AB7G11_11280 [Phycisphaerales bacterium]